MVTLLVRKDAGHHKKMRLQEIKREMAKAIKNGIDRERLLDWIEFNLGLTRKTAAEYVGLIMRVEGWIYLDGKILSEIEAV